MGGGGRGNKKNERYSALLFKLTNTSGTDAHNFICHTADDRASDHNSNSLLYYSHIDHRPHATSRLPPAVWPVETIFLVKNKQTKKNNSNFDPSRSSRRPLKGRRTSIHKTQVPLNTLQITSLTPLLLNNSPINPKIQSSYARDLNIQQRPTICSVSKFKKKILRGPESQPNPRLWMI